MHKKAIRIHGNTWETGTGLANHNVQYVIFLNNYQVYTDCLGERWSRPETGYCVTIILWTTKKMCEHHEKSSNNYTHSF